jgi:hypothetical protein
MEFLELDPDPATQINATATSNTDQAVELVPLLLEVMKGGAGGEVGSVVRLALEAHVLQHSAHISQSSTGAACQIASDRGHGQRLSKRDQGRKS